MGQAISEKHPLFLTTTKHKHKSGYAGRLCLVPWGSAWREKGETTNISRTDSEDETRASVVETLLERIKNLKENDTTEM